jgi:activator of HSP90 ATPase
MRPGEETTQENKMKESLDLRTAKHPETRRQWIARTTVTLGGLALTANRIYAAAPDEEISRTAESIHQEPIFKASPKRIYEALLDSKQFEKVVQLSAAMKSMPAGSKLAEISREPGGAFALFGGYVTGRQIELVPNERIVQVWRAGGWDAGAYSIARFQLTEQGSGTKIVFDHTGFPKGQAEHLAAGWKSNYWEPLDKFLA